MPRLSGPGRARPKGLIVAAAVLLFGAAAGFIMSAFLPVVPDPEEINETAVLEGEAARQDRVVVELPTVIVNRTAPESPGYLRVRVALAVPSEQAQMVSQRTPYLLDMMNAFLPEIGESDLRGSAGLARLRYDLARRFALVVGEVSSQDVLILEILAR